MFNNRNNKEIELFSLSIITGLCLKGSINNCKKNNNNIIFIPKSSEPVQQRQPSTLSPYFYAFLISWYIIKIDLSF